MPSTSLGLAAVDFGNKRDGEEQEEVSLRQAYQLSERCDSCGSTGFHCFLKVPRFLNFMGFPPLKRLA